ncbi:hypothetical protein [Mesorhizobium sp. M0244]|uniref:hypothetical protein n=1 Tax=Mesorhizobium sp. M0244 TaxID=2956926 RepID=UPI003337FF3F
MKPIFARSLRDPCRQSWRQREREEERGGEQRRRQRAAGQKIAACEIREDAPVPIRFVIVVSGWAPLGTSAVDCVKTKKPPAKSSRPGFRERVWT